VPDYGEEEEEDDHVGIHINEEEQVIEVETKANPDFKVNLPEETNMNQVGDKSEEKDKETADLEQEEF